MFNYLNTGIIQLCHIFSNLRRSNRRNIVMRMLVLVATLSLILCEGALPIAHAATSSSVTRDYQLLPKPGEKIPIGAKHYFTYGFTKQPKLGTAIMRVEIFTRDGVRDTSFVVKGDADMPSMRGAHSTGDKDFSLSAKGVYLLPVRLVMPGDWEVIFTITRDGKKAFRGAYLFDL
jgi:hypothetical protein